MGGGGDRRARTPELAEKGSDLAFEDLPGREPVLLGRHPTDGPEQCQRGVPGRAVRLSGGTQCAQQFPPVERGRPGCGERECFRLTHGWNLDSVEQAEPIGCRDQHESPQLCRGAQISQQRHGVRPELDDVTEGDDVLPGGLVVILAPDLPCQGSILEDPTDGGPGDERLLCVEQHFIADPATSERFRLFVVGGLRWCRAPETSHTVGKDPVEFGRVLPEHVRVLRQPNPLLDREPEVLRTAHPRRAARLQEPLHPTLNRSAFGPTHPMNCHDDQIIWYV